MNVKVVVHGTQYEPWQREHYAANDPYKDAKRLNVYKQVQSPIRKGFFCSCFLWFTRIIAALTTGELIERIIAHRRLVLDYCIFSKINIESKLYIVHLWLETMQRWQRKWNWSPRKKPKTQRIINTNEKKFVCLIDKKKNQSFSLFFPFAIVIIIVRSTTTSTPFIRYFDNWRQFTTWKHRWIIWKIGNIIKIYMMTTSLEKVMRKPKQLRINEMKWNQ